MIAYLAYSFYKSKGKRENEQQKRTMLPPTTTEGSGSPEPTLEDIFKKILGGEDELRREQERKISSQKEKEIKEMDFKKELKKKTQQKKAPVFSYENEESLERLESNAEKTNIGFTEIKSSLTSQAESKPAEETQENLFEFNVRDAIIYSTILDRPYR